MQLEYNNQLEVGIEGYRAEYSASHCVDSLNGEHDICFGRAAFASEQNEACVRGAPSKTATFVFGGDVGAGDVISGNLLINGVANAFSVAFDTDQATTAANLAAALGAFTGASAVVDPDDATSRTVVVTADPGSEAAPNGYDVYFQATPTIVGGAAPSVTISATDNGLFEGFTYYEERQPKELPQSLYESIRETAYRRGETVGVLRKGRIWVRSKDALAKGATAFVQLVDGAGQYEKAGMLAASAGAGDVPNLQVNQIVIRKGCAAGGLALVGVNEA